MIQNNPERPDFVDLLAAHRDLQNAVPVPRAGRIDLAEIRARLAATDPEHVDHMIEEVEQLRLGQDAFDLAREYLAAGNLDRARHWLTVAARHTIEQARPLLDDIDVLLEVVDTPQTTAIADGTPLERADTADERERHAVTMDNLHDAADVLRQAQEHARSLVRAAQTTAEEILVRARSEADSPDNSDVALKHLRRSLSQPSPPLTERELQLARGVMMGKSDDQIRRGLFPAPDTVKTQTRRLILVGNRNQLPPPDAMHDMMFIQGPPGTGKTRILTALAEATRARSDPSDILILVDSLTEGIDLALTHVDVGWRGQAPDQYEQALSRVTRYGEADARDHILRLWTPTRSLGAPSIATDYVIGEHGSVSHYAADSSYTEHRQEREQIVAGPKLRQAIDQLKQRQLLMPTGP